MKSNNLNFSANPQINLEIQNFAFSEKLLVKMPSLNYMKVSYQLIIFLDRRNYDMQHNI